MRTVKFNKRIPVKYEGTKRVAGTGGFETNYPNKGHFHTFGLDYEEFEIGAASFTVAIIELENGTIELVLPEEMKFTDKLQL